MKHVEVVRKHSDGSFQSFAPAGGSGGGGGLHPASASFHDVNLEWNPGLGEDPKMKRSSTTPNNVLSSANHEDRLALGSSSAGTSQKSDDKSSSAGQSPPNPMELDEDEIDVYTSGQMGDKARLIR